jgi:carbamoyl-phosphate synthase small subunit
MSIYNANKAWLMLADTTIYEGRSFGATGTAIGEVVFTTSMTGCQETLTDPSYYGQIAVQTFPLIGNYGTNDDDQESDNIFMKGYVVREWCDSPSNFRARERIDAFLKRHNTIGLFDIDTRALTRRLREHGVMNGIITTEPIEDIQKVLKTLEEYVIVDAVDSVTCAAAKTYPSHSTKKYHIALFDFGYKRNIRESLRERGCDVTVVPARTTVKELMEMGLNGVCLSNGPGDPSENIQVIENLKELVQTNIPIMGVCWGTSLWRLPWGPRSKSSLRPTAAATSP